MRFMRADRHSPLRSGARPADARYALVRSFDETAATIATGTAVVAAALVAFCAFLVRL